VRAIRGVFNGRDDAVGVVLSDGAARLQLCTRIMMLNCDALLSALVALWLQ
jgi:hypothetical protein